MKLSEVKTDADWEEYLYRRQIETHEVLRAESGIGPNAYTLPDREYDAGEDVMDRYDREEGL